VLVLHSTQSRTGTTTKLQWQHIFSHRSLLRFFRQQHVGFFQSHNNISPGAGPSPSRSTCCIRLTDMTEADQNFLFSWKRLLGIFHSKTDQVSFDKLGVCLVNGKLANRTKFNKALTKRVRETRELLIYSHKMHFLRKHSTHRENMALENCSLLETQCPPGQISELIITTNGGYCFLYDRKFPFQWPIITIIIVNWFDYYISHL